MDNIDKVLLKEIADIKLDERGSVITNNFQTSIEDAFTGAVEELKSITENDVKDFVKRLLSQGNYRVVILDPKAAE